MVEGSIDPEDSRRTELMISFSWAWFSPIADVSTAHPEPLEAVGFFSRSGKTLNGRCSLQTGGLLFMATTKKNTAPSFVLELIARVAAVAKVFEAVFRYRDTARTRCQRTLRVLDCPRPSMMNVVFRDVVAEYRSSLLCDGISDD